MKMGPGRAIQNAMIETPPERTHALPLDKTPSRWGAKDDETSSYPGPKEMAIGL